MKLAEALLLRSDLQKKLSSLKSRVFANVKVQEGDEPSENPEQLLIECQRLISEISQLVERIHLTNAQTQLDNGKSLISQLNERDTLAQRHKLLIQTIEEAKADSDRYSYREIRWQSTVDIAGLYKQADDIAKKLREINLTIQSANWQIDLL